MRDFSLTFFYRAIAHVSVMFTNWFQKYIQNLFFLLIRSKIFIFYIFSFFFCICSGSKIIHKNDKIDLD